jgi:Zn-finger nucleic acid-binding protein
LHGVTIELCSDCRGVFLDVGELERIRDRRRASLAVASGSRRPASWSILDADPSGVILDVIVELVFGVLSP